MIAAFSSVKKMLTTLTLGALFAALSFGFTLVGVIALWRASARTRRDRDSLGSALAASEAVSAALGEEALFLAAVLSSVDAAIVLLGRDGRVRFVNERFEETFGVRAGDVLGRSRAVLRAAIGPCFADRAAFIRHDEEEERRPSEVPRGGRASGEAAEDELELVIERPARRVILWSASFIRQNEHTVGDLILFRDVTKQRAAEEARERLVEELEAQARTDALTGLANRRFAGESLAQEIERARRYGRPLSVVMFDIDHFKRVNDRYGHAVGDRVLRTFSDVLRATARATDVVARWGGEEFLAILHEAEVDAAAAFADRVRVALEVESVGVDGKPITVSAGVAALAPDDGAETLVRRADDALYRAKDGGRNQVVRDSSPVSSAAPSSLS